MGDDCAVQQIFCHHILNDFPQCLEDAQLDFLHTFALWRTAFQTAFDPGLEFRSVNEFLGAFAFKCTEVHFDEIVYRLNGHIWKKNFCCFQAALQWTAVDSCNTGINISILLLTQFSGTFIRKRKIGAANINAAVIGSGASMSNDADAVTFHVLPPNSDSRLTGFRMLCSQLPRR